MTPKEVFLSAPVLNGMLEELDRKPGLETGGLLGCLRDERCNIVVMLGTGPGANARHGATHLFMSAQQIPRVTERFESLLSSSSELHSWHSHPPGVAAKPSGGDMRSARHALMASNQTGLLMVILERARRVRLGAYWIERHGGPHALRVHTFGALSRDFELLHPAYSSPPKGAWYATQEVRSALSQLQLSLCSHGLSTAIRVNPEMEQIWIQIGCESFQVRPGFPKTPMLHTNGQPIEPWPDTVEDLSLRLSQQVTVSSNSSVMTLSLASSNHA